MGKSSILFLTNAYPDFEDSYRAIFIKKMAELLLGGGYEVSVVTPKIYAGSPYSEEQNGIMVYRFPFFARDKLLIEHRKIPYLKMILYYISGFFLTIYIILKHKINLIHVHWAIPTGLIGVLAGKVLRKPVVVTIHGSDFRMAMENPTFLGKIFLYVCQKSKKIMCVSETQEKGIQTMGVKAEKIVAFPMGISENFLKVGRRRVEKLNGQFPIVLSNRNLLPLYNVSLLIRAIPRVLKEEPHTKFFIAGHGAEKEALERQVKELNIDSSVRFLGRVPHEEMPDLLSRADIYVSTSPHDGTSVSLLEAMGSGAFPIVTDIPANQEWIIDAENGFLIPIENEYILARKIIGAIRNKKLLSEASEKNRKIIEQRAHWRANIKKIIDIYERAFRIA
jgi:glycosyltransferase involved in cell wall biosynthesis